MMRRRQGQKSRASRPPLWTKKPCITATSLNPIIRNGFVSFSRPQTHRLDKKAVLHTDAYGQKYCPPSA